MTRGRSTASMAPRRGKRSATICGCRACRTQTYQARRFCRVCGPANRTPLSERGRNAAPTRNLLRSVGPQILIEVDDVGQDLLLFGLDRGAIGIGRRDQQAAQVCGASVGKQRSVEMVICGKRAGWFIRHFVTLTKGSTA